MKIGFSIQSPALLSSTNKKEKSPYLGQEKSLRDFLVYLKDTGVTSIEIRILERHADSSDFEEAVQMIWDLGLEITVHGDLNGSISKGKFIEVYPGLQFILNNFKKYQENLIIPIHAFQAESGNSNELKRETVNILKEWTRKIEEESLPIYIALENNRKKGVIDPGNSVNGVLEMVNKINSPHVGICWDMGHYYSNLMKEYKSETRPTIYYEDMPPTEFLEKVFHTHIHGLNELGTTHYPLNDMLSLPLENYVSILKNKGFKGVYNLELSLERWGVINYNHYISETIKRLSKTM